MSLGRISRRSDVFSTVHHSIELYHLPTLMHSSLLINNMYVTLQSSTCFQHQHAHRQEDNTICPPDDGHVDARNMSRHIVNE